MGKIVVVGSINMDIVNEVEQHPLPGETIYGQQTSYHAGGKGANQAVAAARAGAQVVMAGAIGRDVFGAELRGGLAAYGIDTETVLQKDGTSGLAFVNVNAAGENNIILSPGANGMLEQADLAVFWPRIQECSAVMMQNEIPWDISLTVMKHAAALGKRVYFNPAPAFSLPEDAFPYIECLILNETEAAVITGQETIDEHTGYVALDMLVKAGISSAVLTLGGKGALYADQEGLRVHVPAFAVEAVDTTAAGDTFIGAYAAQRENGETIEQALRFAAAAAAISVTRPGAQPSIPAREEVMLILV